MAETYFLKLMGFPELHRPDGRPVKLKVRKHLALLIYLVMDGRALYFRDELAELLWPGVPAENSRHSLSMAFSVLRGLFGADCIKGNHAEVQFRAPRLGLDLDRIEAGEILGSATALPLEVDGFLRGFHIEDAPAFQHWRDRRHAQLLPLIQAAMLTLVDQARRSADLSRMLAMADRLLALDPLAEEGIRARMEAFAIQGDRVSALREFEGWKRELDREIGAVPSELLEAMAARLRRGIQSPSAPVQLRESDGGLAMPRFIGRAAEYGVLFEAWERTTQLNTRHVLLTGETGIGKSTLAMRFAAAAALEGAAVARVQCFELEQRMAFGMIGALVTPLLELPGVLGTAPESLAEVARMVPKVREKFPHLPAPRHSEGEAARLHFAEGTLALLDAIMEEQPILLIVDDYPRSDEASLSVLHLLLRRAVNDRLMVVLSGRPPEEDESPQAARIRQGVPHLPLDRIELTPLAGEECDELLGALLSGVGREPGSPERRAILRTAGGNPMALELLTQDWLTHGDAALAVLLPAMGDDVPGSALEAVGYDRLIERMLPTMTPRTRVALYLAAILGPRLNELECFEVLDFTAGQTMAALSELVQQRVLRNTARGLEFVNELIRARLYLKIPTAARVRLHHAVADRLLAAVAGGEEVPGLEIAWHCIRARRREEATPFLMNGAREAITHGAPDEAARALSSAIGQLKGRAKAEATLLLAETYQEMAEWGDALECVRDISQDHKSDPSVREVADILELSSNLQLDAYPIEEIPALVQDLALRTATYEEPRARARAASWAACLAASLRREDLLLSVREALSRIELAQLDPRDQSLVWMARAMVFYNTRERKAGIEALRTASSQARSIGTLDSTFVHIHTGFGTLVLSEGRYGEAAESLHIAYKAATRLDNMPLITQAAANLSLC
ncbi:MAG TPA: AAA family ATPase, partial [Gemmatimonadales bacterium]